MKIKGLVFDILGIPGLCNIAWAESDIFQWSTFNCHVGFAALKMFTRNARFQLIIWPAKNLPNTFWNLCFWDTHTEVRTHIHTRTWRAIVLLCSIPWNECANKEMGGELRNPRSNTSRIRQWQVNELNASTSSPRASSKTSQICHLSFTMMHRSHPFTTLATNSWYLTTHKFLSQHHDCLKIVLNSSWL